MFSVPVSIAGRGDAPGNSGPSERLVIPCRSSAGISDGEIFARGCIPSRRRRAASLSCPCRGDGGCHSCRASDIPTFRAVLEDGRGWRALQDGQQRLARFIDLRGDRERLEELSAAGSLVGAVRLELPWLDESLGLNSRLWEVPPARRSRRAVTSSEAVERKGKTRVHCPRGCLLL